MAVGSGFKHYKDKALSGTIATETYTFDIEPLFCHSCLGRIGRILGQNQILPISMTVTKWGEKTGDQTGTLEVVVTANISKEDVASVIQKGFTVKDNANARLVF
ncbi:MAG TPA: hypothetical protein PLD88_02545 [Candidatus Berkiella sp.]|nr:hypothetical protein [Candidatus Berkiella sp.]